MGKLRWLSILMIFTILGLTGFQLYWLKENYDREENALDLKTQFNFRETILKLQVSRLNLNLPDSVIPGGMRVFMQKDGKPMAVRVNPRDEVASTINVIREKIGDSLPQPPVSPNKVMISVDQTSVSVTKDSVKIDRQVVGNGKSHIYNFLYGVDSLQDSIRVFEIDSAYQLALKKEKLDVPFTISRSVAAERTTPPELNKVTVGIRNPVTYELSLGNTFPYLLRRISLPILFSVVLLGFTILSFVLLYRNLVRQKKLAELKNEFISNITHELKTPIATVGVAIEALKNFNAIKDPQKTREYLEISSNELQRLGLLVDKVLKLSMFEKKEIDLKMEPLNLGEIRDEVLASLRLQLEKVRATVSIKEAGNLDMQGDRLHMLSVIFNLVDNAVKYSSGVPEIEIGMEGRDTELEVNVKDRGIGIPDEYKGKVFDKFFRVPHGELHNAKGYGLGLSYVAQVIKKHGGIISISDRVGGGSVITFTLPKQRV